MHNSKKMTEIPDIKKKKPITDLKTAAVITEVKNMTVITDRERTSSSLPSLKIWQFFRHRCHHYLAVVTDIKNMAQIITDFKSWLLSPTTRKLQSSSPTKINWAVIINITVGFTAPRAMLQSPTTRKYSSHYNMNRALHWASKTEKHSCQHSKNPRTML